MFDGRAFESWPLILAIASLFAALFGGITLLGVLLIGGEGSVERSVLSIAGLAFIGYVAVAWCIRHER
ncbi:MAG: hypothetical protein AAGI71_06460 [Bacteroidota bacterium]